ncbi:MAG: glucose 1-dehydrogenase [Deltaproteobacteria bacterium]|nr:glucose 1-dehydrogenase [Deltaproteobacteria bacterium]MCB9787944.1 glucose 1-dehydrogenase [Deltaproteobacteria bacterium]
MSRRLEDTVAIITGASRGIGEAIARAFVAEGARVVLASRKQDALDETRAAIVADLGGDVIARACHTGDTGQVQALIDYTESKLGVPTVLVNNAATNPYFGPMLGVGDAAWEKTFAVNVRGYFEAARAVSRRLMETNSPGAIINVASILGMGAAPLQGVYGMTKAAVISMTQTLAIELGPSKIRVNAIAPGLVETRFASALTSNPKIAEHFTARTAEKRWAQPEEIAGAAVFLASAEAGFITGQTLAVDGGYSIS